MCEWCFVKCVTLRSLRSPRVSGALLRTSDTGGLSNGVLGVREAAQTGETGQAGTERWALVGAVAWSTRVCRGGRYPSDTTAPHWRPQAAPSCTRLRRPRCRKAPYCLSFPTKLRDKDSSIWLRVLLTHLKLSVNFM